MERIVIVSILSALLVQLTAARATAEGNYKKICRVSENLRVLDDSADANSCRAIAVDSQAQEYQIGCRDSENTGTIIVTAPFHITDKAARVTSSKLAAYAQNTAAPEQFAKCAKAGEVDSSRKIRSTQATLARCPLMTQSGHRPRSTLRGPDRSPARQRIPLS